MVTLSHTVGVIFKNKVFICSLPLILAEADSALQDAFFQITKSVINSTVKEKITTLM